MIVWIVNPFDNLPMEGNRPQRYWLMAKAFVRAGHEVVYWTSDFSHATKAKRVEKVERVERVEKGIEVIQIPTLPYKKNICWARAKSHRKLARDFEALAASILSTSSTSSTRPNLPDSLSTSSTSSTRLKSPDLVIASTPPLSLCAAAMRIARKANAKFVCDIQDAWPETFERILPRFVWSLLGLRRAAKEIYCGADIVTAVSQRYLDLAKSYGCTAPMHLAGHCIEISDSITAEKSANATSPSNSHASTLRLVYIGNMSLSYDLATVINVVRELPDVTLDIAGNGPDRTHLEELAKSAPNIRLHGYLNESDLSTLLHQCDVGLIPMFQESCVGVPGKLADYAAAGLRIIESLGGECQSLISQFNAGVHYTAGNPDSFKSAISHFQSNSAANIEFSRFANQFSAVKVMDEYVSVL